MSFLQWVAQNWTFEVWPHQCQVQTDGQSLSWSCWTTLLLIQARMLLSFLAIRTHWLVFSWLLTSIPRSFSIRQLSKHWPQPSVLHGVVTQGQDPALSFVEPLDSPSIQPVQGAPADQYSHITWCCLHANWPRGHLITSPRLLMKVLNRTYPYSEPWGTSLVTSCQLEVIPFTTSLGLAIQPVFHPAKSVLVQP